jgi:hypothetical protein
LDDSCRFVERIIASSPSSCVMMAWQRHAQQQQQQQQQPRRVGIARHRPAQPQRATDKAREQVRRQSSLHAYMELDVPLLQRGLVVHRRL